jgi:hypothetical protein
MAEPASPPPGPDLAARDRARRRADLALTPRERLSAMQQLIDRAWEVLARHPEGLAHFKRRNFKARSIRRQPELGTDGT